MLTLELAGIRFNKSARRRALTPKLNDRSEGAVEFKHQNISAVLLGLNQPWINGYKPASQFQLSLVDEVLRRADVFENWDHAIEAASEGVAQSGRSKQPRALRDPASLFVGPAPTLSNRPPEVDPSFSMQITRRYNAAERDENNRSLGRSGEQLVLAYEKYRLRSVGQKDLAESVVWTADVEGDGAGYDIASFKEDGSPRLIEVKTTNGYERSPFHISRNELSVSGANRDHWVLFRVYDFSRSPKAFELFPPLERHLELSPTSFLAKLN